MASFDDIYVKGQIFNVKDPVGPEVLGRGPFKIRGSSYIQGPALIGDHKTWPNITATVMIGPLKNSDSPKPYIPASGLVVGVGTTGVGIGTSSKTCEVSTVWSPFSLAVFGGAIVYENLLVSKNVIKPGSGNIVAEGEVKSQCGEHVLSSKKNFDIPHPTKEGWRLTHACLEGPEAAVYFRGRLTNKSIIKLPEYWKKLVDSTTITVSITPIGSHQDIIVKRVSNVEIALQSKGGFPIDCFYHVFGERMDTEKLIVEYEGNIEDYPGDNYQRSISGYHYDVKGDSV
jgi:hypothetical protein